VQSILEASLSSYRHELLISNLQGIPLLLQHGRADDNVPVFHARLMKTLLEQVSGSSSYLELPKEGHVFPGMMATRPLANFYQSQLSPDTNHAKTPHEFTLTVARPSDTTSKYGVTIAELITPGQLGTAKVVTVGQNTTKHYYMSTSNVRTISIACFDQRCPELTLDHQAVTITTKNQSSLALENDVGGGWHVLEDSPVVRRASGLDSILQTHGRFKIYSGRNMSESAMALQISRNMCQYFNADADLLYEDEKNEQDNGNIIRIVITDRINLSPSFNTASPRASNTSSVQVTDHDGNVHSYDSDNGLGAIFINQTLTDRSELVIWGSTESGLDIAARLVPMLTGVGQPDFVIADRNMLWKSAGGVLAMGFFDRSGRASTNSYFS